jgi:hypothetical protein
MERGQSTPEYVGVVTIVALALGLAGTVAAPDIPRTLAHHLRVGLCIVGGDVCRSGDAARAGLRPCVLTAREAGQHTSVTLATVTYGVDDDMVIERRSDGSARVSFARRDQGGLKAAVALRLGPHVNVEAEAGAAVGWTSGNAWEFRDEAALSRFLKRSRLEPGHFTREGIPAPAERFRAVSGSAAAEAGARILGLGQPLANGGGRAAIGRRTRGRRTSWYFDASRDGAHLLGGLMPAVELAQGRGWVIELSDHPRELRLTSSLPGDTEIEARLDLESPVNAAVARALLERPTPARARALGRHMAEHGTVERRHFQVRELGSKPEIGIALGIVGFDHGGDAHERTLLSAEVLRPGGSARRADCLGL